MEKGNKKVITAWTFYDWANSVYNLVITATILPIYYKAVTITKDDAGNEISNVVTFLGIQFKNTTLYDYSLALANLIVAAFIPLLSGIADYGGSKKKFMQFFCYLGAASCSLMYFFTRDNLAFGIFLIVFASVGFWGSLVFYNAFLPEIAEVQHQDKVSARGFAMGYVGSSLLLIFNLMMVQKPEWFGISDAGMATRISFLTVGIWWIGFAQIPFYYLPGKAAIGKSSENMLTKGYQELRKVWKDMKHNYVLRSYLLAFFVYNMGVQTVLLVATLFGAQEIKMETGQLITTILIIQFVALIGAYLFSFVSKKIGNIRTLMIAVCIWIGACLGTYFFCYTPNDFFVVAGFVGLVMGGIQSLSRSTYSKLLPETDDHASYFSFYDVTEKVCIVLGMATFGIINEMSTNMRKPIIMLIVFFILGFLLLLRVPKGKMPVSSTNA
ncbi:MAG: MFS transporter [Bacteroidia bacterium]|nr:MFS transporter [Bacteroidia bacterium]